MPLRERLPVLLAAPVVIAGGYLGALTVAGAARSLDGRRPVVAPDGPTTRFLVLIPAHDEGPLIGRVVGDLACQEYPADLREVYVIADHCTDDTPERASAAGATVLRHDDPEPRGKGAALRWALGQLRPPDDVVVVIIDADTTVDHRFLAELEIPFRNGFGVAQGYYGVHEAADSPATSLRHAALAARHFLRPLGRTTLGASSGLFGNGMGFRASVLERRPPSDHLVEDQEMYLDLVLDGERIAFVPSARVAAEMPLSLDASRSQHERWERGRLELVPRYAPRLVRRAVTGPHRVAQADALLDLLIPPLSTLVLGSSVVAIVAHVMGRSAGRARWSAWWASASLAVQVTHVLVAMVAVRSPRSAYAALLHAPSALVWKAALWGRMLVQSSSVPWQRTNRDLRDR